MQAELKMYKNLNLATATGSDRIRAEVWVDARKQLVLLVMKVGVKCISTQDSKHTYLAAQDDVPSRATCNQRHREFLGKSCPVPHSESILTPSLVQPFIDRHLFAETFTTNLPSVTTGAVCPPC